MEHIDGHFTGPKKHQIYYQAWLPDGKAKAVLLLAHGMGEHCGRYDNVVNHFVPLGYAIYALDHIGHGRSSGKREFIDSFDDFIQTFRIYHTMVQAWQPEQPLYLLGHSMGGTIAVTYLLQHQDEFDGAILSSPALKPADPVPGILRSFCRILSGIVPMMGVLSIDAKGLSHDPKVAETYLSDSLNFTKRSPVRLVSQMLDTMEHIEGCVHQLNLPILILQGDKDRIVNPAGAQMLYNKARSTDKQVHVYENLLHELFNELEKEKILKDVELWLESRI